MTQIETNVGTVKIGDLVLVSRNGLRWASVEEIDATEGIIWVATDDAEMEFEVGINDLDDIQRIS